MIFLEQITNQILREEGQVIISLSDLGITWDDIESLFIGTYEQAKNYITIYEWEEKVIGNEKQQYDIAHVKHITYNAYNNMQRFMPDVPDQYWEFNPYTKNISSLINTNFSVDVAKHATIGNLDYTITLEEIKKNRSYTILLPFTPSYLDIKNGDEIIDMAMDELSIDAETNCLCIPNNTYLHITNNDASISGNFYPNKLKGNIKFGSEYDSLALNFTSKYVGIKELDMTCELFYKWFKANLLVMIGSIKSQINIGTGDMPFDFTQDTLLERGRQIMDQVEELKGTKSHWSNF